MATARSVSPCGPSEQTVQTPDHLAEVPSGLGVECTEPKDPGVVAKERVSLLNEGCVGAVLEHVGVDQVAIDERVGRIGRLIASDPLAGALPGGPGVVVAPEGGLDAPDVIRQIGAVGVLVALGHQQRQVAACLADWSPS